MSKMIAFICVVWISGNRAEGGITKCMFHESSARYETTQECKNDIMYSRNLIRIRLRQEFQDRPEDFIIQVTCTGGA
jgi:hypothetical protein